MVSACRGGGVVHAGPGKEGGEFTGEMSPQGIYLIKGRERVSLAFLGSFPSLQKKSTDKNNNIMIWNGLYSISFNI